MRKTELDNEQWRVVTLKIKLKRNHLGGYIARMPGGAKPGLHIFNTAEMREYLEAIETNGYLSELRNRSQYKEGTNMITVKGIYDPETNKVELVEPEVEPEPEQEPIENEPVMGEVESEVQAQARLAKSLGASVEITGKWAWATWASKPDDKARQALKDNKWIWCRNKGKWAWRGQPSASRKAMPWDYIADKYGVEKLEDKELVIINK